jgi:hypothetical protein
MTLAAARAARLEYGDVLAAHPDVHGLGVGLRRRRGVRTDAYAVVVLVDTKLPARLVPTGRLLPEEVTVVLPEGPQRVRVDVQQRPRPVPERAGGNPRDRFRPVPGGVSAGWAGTLGGWVRDTASGRAVALSNRHVFGAAVGEVVPQPARDDGGTLPSDVVATVLRVSQTFDAAVAAPTDLALVTAVMLGGGPAVVDVADAAVGDRVEKTGRTTGRTVGVVELVDYRPDDRDTFDLWIDGGDADFSDAGDSGALYLLTDADQSGARAAVGLHWGGSAQDGVGHHLRPVLDDLRLTTLDRASQAERGGPVRAPA